MSTVKERPILFSGAMVRALLAGSKTQTRREAKHPLAQAAVRILSYNGQSEFDCVLPDETGGIILCPYGQPGDRLWVRETFRYTPELEDNIKYRAGYSQQLIEALAEAGARWRPSIFMPRAASRLLLEIVAVRVERVQDISVRDMRAEGCEVREFRFIGAETAAQRQQVAADIYGALWASINGPDSWAANPWVWVVEFKVLAGGKEVASA